MLAEAVLCLSLNVYHEARGEPKVGQIAVALATRNRVRKEGSGYCWEVFKHAQFSWTADARKMGRLPTGEAWESAQRIARYVIRGAHDFTRGATHYHNSTVMPRWARAMELAGSWGDHRFYRARPPLGYNGGSRKAKTLKAIIHSQEDAAMRKN
jgi:N-acetylmuramoyl-L-alanine amidase